MNQYKCTMSDIIPQASKKFGFTAVATVGTKVVADFDCRLFSIEKVAATKLPAMSVAIECTGAYAQKEELKGMGFKWNADNSSWGRSYSLPTEYDAIVKAASFIHSAFKA